MRDPRPVNLLSGEVYYRLSLRSVEIGLSGYVTTTRGESDVRHYYDDLAGEFSEYGVERHRQKALWRGRAGRVTVRLTDRWSLRGAAAFSDNTYLSDPAADIYADRDNRPVAVARTAYLKGYRSGGSAEPWPPASSALFRAGACGRLPCRSITPGATTSTSVPCGACAECRIMRTSPEALQEMTSQEQFGDATTVSSFLVSVAVPLPAVIAPPRSAGRSTTSQQPSPRSFAAGMSRCAWHDAFTGSGLDRTVAPMASRYYHAYPRAYYLTFKFPVLMRNCGFPYPVYCRQTVPFVAFGSRSVVAVPGGLL
ncbi:MAG: hypothetical protein ACLTZY_10960 [Alistipes indistinctus]